MDFIPVVFPSGCVGNCIRGLWLPFLWVIYAIFKAYILKHPLNFFVLLIVFVGSFSFASIALADYYYISAGGGVPTITGSTASEACSAYVDYKASTVPQYSWRIDSVTETMCLHSDTSNYGNWSGKAQSIRNFECGTSTEGLCAPPAPPEPQSCQELADQNPDPFSMQLPGGFTMTACRSGCKVVSAGGVSIDDADGYFGKFYYTSSPCPGGFDAAAGDVTDVMDVYENDEELQNCYTPDGILIGRVGISLSCPENVYACYDRGGKFTGTAPGGSECAIGSKNFSNESPVSETSTTKTVCDAEGNCTTTVETKKTETGADGSKVTTTTKKATTCISTGKCTTTTETSVSTDDEAQGEKENEEGDSEETEKGSFDLVKASDELGLARKAYSDAIDIVKEEVADAIGFNFSGRSGSIESNKISIRGASGDIGLTKWVPYFDDIGLSALILFLAAMYSAYILLGGSHD